MIAKLVIEVKEMHALILTNVAIVTVAVLTFASTRLDLSVARATRGSMSATRIRAIAWMSMNVVPITVAAVKIVLIHVEPITVLAATSITWKPMDERAPNYRLDARK